MVTEDVVYSTCALQRGGEGKHMNKLHTCMFYTMHTQLNEVVQGQLLDQDVHKLLHSPGSVVPAFYTCSNRQRPDQQWIFLTFMLMTLQEVCSCSDMLLLEGRECCWGLLYISGAMATNVFHIII